MGGSSLAVSLRSVTKRFGSHLAVAGFDLDIPRGSIYGLLGPNGSGKTTMIRMIMGILHPDEGEVRLFGPDTVDSTRRRAGYLPEERGLYQKMKVLDLLVFLAELKGVRRVDGRRRAAAWLDRLGLADWSDARVEDLSKGMQQKTQFIGTVLHEPDLLVLDEPFSGLDPINQDVLELIVREFSAKGATVVFSTHLMDQAERLCDRVCLIATARKVLDGRLDEIKSRGRRDLVAVRWDGPDGWLEGPEVARVMRVRGGADLQLRDGTDPHAILRRGLEAGAAIRRFETLQPTLHEIFVSHVRGESDGWGDRRPGELGSEGSGG